MQLESPPPVRQEDEKYWQTTSASPWLPPEHLRQRRRRLRPPPPPPAALQSARSCLELMLTFGAKFVLEVLGGAGAVWGSSEVLLLRTSANVHVWRPISIFFGSLFFLRWCSQFATALRQAFQKRQREDCISHSNSDLEDDNSIVLRYQYEDDDDESLALMEFSPKQGRDPEAALYGTTTYHLESADNKKDNDDDTVVMDSP